MDFKVYAQSNDDDDGNIEVIPNGNLFCCCFPHPYTQTHTSQFEFQSDLIVYKSICNDFHQAHQN